MYRQQCIVRLVEPWLDEKIYTEMETRSYLYNSIRHFGRWDDRECSNHSIGVFLQYSYEGTIWGYQNGHNFSEFGEQE